MGHLPAPWGISRGAGLAVALLAALASSQTGPVSRTFSAPYARVWAVTESVLQSLGWDIDRKDREVGWLLTESRGVEFKDFAVYGEGTRHRLRVTLRRAGETATTVTIERELWKEERILWMKDRKPLRPTDTAVEAALLEAIAQSLP